MTHLRRKVFSTVLTPMLAFAGMFAATISHAATSPSLEVIEQQVSQIERIIEQMRANQGLIQGAQTTATSSLTGALRKPRTAAGITVLSGWAYDSKTPSRFVTVEILRNSEVIGTIVADDAGPLATDGVQRVQDTHWFDFAVPVRFYGVSGSYWARGVDSLGRKHTLPGTYTEMPGPIATAASRYFWYEDNSNTPIGLPLDFMARYETAKMGDWKHSRANMDVFLIPAFKFGAVSSTTSTKGFSDEFITKKLIPALQGSSTMLALNVTGTTHGTRKNIQEFELSVVRRIKSLGGRVDYFAFQSPLSKSDDKPQSVDQDRTIDERVADVVNNAVIVNKEFPEIKFVVTDALVHKSIASGTTEYKIAYKKLKDAMTSKGLVLDSIIFDGSLSQWLQPTSKITVEKIIEAEKFTQELGIKVIRQLSARNGGQISEQRYHDQVIAGYDKYLKAGGNADAALLLSFYTYPQYTIPETAVGTTSYPQFRNYLEVVDLYHADALADRK